MIKPLFDNVLLKKDNDGELTAGSKVVFSDNYKKVSFKNEEYFLVNEEEVLAVIEE